MDIMRKKAGLCGKFNNIKPEDLTEVQDVPKNK